MRDFVSSKAMVAVAIGAFLTACGARDGGLVANVEGGAVRGAVIVTGGAGLEDPAIRSVVTDYAARENIAVFSASGLKMVGADGSERTVGELCAGADERLATELGRASAVWLEGSDAELADCVWKPETLAGALDGLFMNGIATGGSGWAATFAGEYAPSRSIDGAEAIANGFGSELARGRGYAEDTVFLDDSGPGDRLGVLLAALMETGAVYGIAVDGGGAVVEPERGRVSAIGSKPTVFIDMTDAKVSRSKRRIENARITLLCPGDTWDMEAGMLRFVAGKSGTASKNKRNMPEQRDAWADGTVLRLVRLLADSERGTALSARSYFGGTNHTVRVSSDAETRLFRALDEENTPDDLKYTIVDVRLDLLPQR